MADTAAAAAAAAAAACSVSLFGEKMPLVSATTTVSVTDSDYTVLTEFTVHSVNVTALVGAAALAVEAAPVGLAEAASHGLLAAVTRPLQTVGPHVSRAVKAITTALGVGMSAQAVAADTPPGGTGGASSTVDVVMADASAQGSAGSCSAGTETVAVINVEVE